MAYGKQFQKNNYNSPAMFRPSVPEMDDDAAALARARDIVAKHESRPSRHHGPLKTFKVGAIQVSVWENENTSPDGQVYVSKSVTFERRYKDKNGEWKSTNSLRANDLPKAIVLLQQAYEYMLLSGGDE